jgi:arginine/lysine/ornithine decarboxylase
VPAPGELVTEQVVDYFQEITAAGAFVEGLLTRTSTACAWSPDRARSGLAAIS